MDFRIGLLFLCLTVYIKATPLFNKDEPIDPKKYRISNIDDVENYKVDLTLNDDFDTFSGKVVVKFTIKEKTKNIVLNAVALEGLDNVDNFKLEITDSNDEVTTGSIDEKPILSELYETLTITTVDDIPEKSIVSLTIDNFTGKLATDMKGFYKSTYEDAKEVLHTIATTQFQSIFARRAFPCFDEPSFKATFDFTIIYPSKDGYTCLFNTEAKTEPTSRVEEGKRISEFVTTPKMSTYLVAFVISDFVKVDKKYGEKPFNVWSREDAKSTAEHASVEAVKAIEHLEEFTDIPYELKKMDQVAIPDFSAGAMENWGLATYRETALLWDANESTKKYKQRVTTVIAHEFSHMWFGDLVTLDWWSNTWLNEGFASYFEYHIAGKIHDDWEMDNQFVVDEQQQIMLDDALINAKPLSSKEEDVYTIAQINDKFSTITYNKGGSVIRMLEHIVGSDNFKASLQKYLKSLKYQNTDPKKLLDSFNTIKELDLPNADMNIIMKNWIYGTGYPVLHVTANGGDIIVKQEQFLFAKPDDAAKKTWYVPISYTDSKELNFDNTAPKTWIKEDADEIKIEQALKDEITYLLFNIRSTGYYRVNYDTTLLSAIKKQLKDKHDKIHAINRAQLVDDAMNLARAGVIKYSEALSLTEYLSKETDYYPWVAAFRNFNYLRMRFGNNGDTGKLITEKLKTLTTELNKVISFDDVAEGQVDSLKQELAMQWACELENEKCISMSKKKFDEFKENSKIIPAEFRSIVYCSVLRHDEKNGTNFKYLQEKLKASKLATETITLITALGCSTNKELLNNYLEDSIKEDSYIRNQDANYVFNAVLTGNLDGVPIALDFLVKKWKAISETYGGMNALSGIITSVANRITEPEDQKKFTEFIANTKDELGDAAEQADAAIEQLKANEKWKKENKKVIESYLNPAKKDDNNNGYMTTGTIFILLTAYIFINLF